MEQRFRSVRPFIGAKDFALSRRFYVDVGFEENILSPVLSVFKTKGASFYLQDAYVKDWIDNSMLFLEVEDLYQVYQELFALDLPSKYNSVKLSPVRVESWGRECFLHDPAEILWHIGEFI